MEKVEKSEKYGTSSTGSGQKKGHDQTNIEASNTTTTTTTTTTSTTTSATSSNDHTTDSLPKGFVRIEGLDPASFQNKVVDRILGCIYGILVLLSLVLFPPFLPVLLLLSPPSTTFLVISSCLLFIGNALGDAVGLGMLYTLPLKSYRFVLTLINLLIFTKQRPSL